MGRPAADADALEDKLIGRILPHELAHATLEARFVKAPPPLYLQEGLAVAAEADGHRAAILRVGLAVAEGRDVPPRRRRCSTPRATAS